MSGNPEWTGRSAFFYDYPDILVKRRYLHHKLAKSIFGTALLFAVLISVGLFLAELERAGKKAVAMVNQLLDTVESAAAISAYSGNRQIGEDVLKGLLSNDIVHEARLTNERGLELHRIRNSDTTSGEKVVRTLHSPFGEEVVGHLVVVPESKFNLAEARHSALYSALNSTLLIGLTALIVLQVVRSSLSRPLMSVSDTLHAIKAGEQERLEYLPRHSDDELGQLVHDVNGLLDTLEERWEAERVLRIEIQAMEYRLRSIFETTSAGIFQLDFEGRLRMANPTLARVLRLAAPHPEKQVREDFLNRVFAEPDCLHDFIRETGEAGKPLAVDLKLKGHADVWIHCLFSRQTDSSGNGFYEGVVYDITERRAAEKQIRLEANYDPLTGLYRRQPAERALKKLLKIPPNGEAAPMVMLLDLDNFKDINDNLGHAAGDVVLVEVARRLKSCVRAGDIVARLGGDEFLIVLVGCDSVEHACSIAREIVRTVVQPIRLGADSSGQVGISIGIVSIAGREQSVNKLFEAADLAMYEVKRQGKNGFATMRADGSVTVEKVVDREIDGSNSAIRGARGLIDAP